jgi:hypothetical protein
VSDNERRLGGVLRVGLAAQSTLTSYDQSPRVGIGPELASMGSGSGAADATARA